MFEWIDTLPLLPAIGILLIVIYLRAGATYALGRKATSLAGKNARSRRIINAPRVTKAVDALNRYGAPIVALSFLTIGFQTACNLAAGVTRMPLRYYLPALAVGGLAWAVIYATVGLAALALWWEMALTNPVVAVLILALAIGLLTWFIMRRRAARACEAREAEAERQDAGVT